MKRPHTYWVLIFGIVTPVASILLYALVYVLLTQRSRNLEGDWLFRLTLSTLAMTLPTLLTLALAITERRRETLSRSAKVGLTFALLSLGLVAKPVSDGILRFRQSHNQALSDTAAPPFETTDLSGQTQRLSDQKGKVVLVSLWATWCGPCRAEMPKLDTLYRTRKERGFVVFGLSDEGVDTQRKYLEKIHVSYPLLTVTAGVPGFYRDIVRYPAMFLIDRQGRLQPTPAPDQPFTKVEAAVDALLNSNPSGGN